MLLCQCICVLSSLAYFLMSSHISDHLVGSRREKECLQEIRIIMLITFWHDLEQFTTRWLEYDITIWTAPAQIKNNGSHSHKQPTKQMFFFKTCSCECVYTLRNGHQLISNLSMKSFIVCFETVDGIIKLDLLSLAVCPDATSFAILF